MIHVLETERTTSTNRGKAITEMKETEMAEVDVIRLHVIEEETILKVAAVAIDKQMVVGRHVQVEGTEVTTEAIIEDD